MVSKMSNYKFPTRKDGVENTNPYGFIEDIIRGWLNNSCTQTVDDRVDTYREITQSFLVISRHVSEVLGYFKTVANGDPAADFYLPRIMDLEIIFTTTHTLMSRFHSLAMLSLTGSKEDVSVSCGFCFSCLTAITSLKYQIESLMDIKHQLEKHGALADCGCRGGLYHPSNQYFNSDGDALIH